MKRSRFFYFAGTSIVIVIALFFIALAYVFKATSSKSTSAPAFNLKTEPGASQTPTPPSADQRETLRISYKAMLSSSMPHLNFIEAKLVKSKKGYELYGVHNYFSRFSFDIGHLAKDVSAWINHHNAELSNAGIVRVGVKDAQDGSATYFDVR